MKSIRQFFQIAIDRIFLTMKWRLPNFLDDSIGFNNILMKGNYGSYIYLRPIDQALLLLTRKFTIYPICTI